MKSHYKLIIACCLLLVCNSSCKKFLETKSVQSLSTPSTLSDLEAILNNSSINIGTALLNGMTDEYYFPYSVWQTRSELHKKGYVWDAQLNDYNDWSQQYNAVFNANTVLFNLGQIENNDVSRSNNIKGSALFYRALAFYRIAQLYSLQYNSSIAGATLGIPLRLKADINDVSIRSTLQDTYAQILGDLNQALNLITDVDPTNVILKSHPTKAAVYGLLARIYLQMNDYANAKENVNKALAIHHDLIDFNDNAWVNASSLSPFTMYNPEIIFYSLSVTSPNSNAAARIDSNLFWSYDANDLRKTAYFAPNTDGTYHFKGSYSGNSFELFCGIATDELYLIRAECYAREGNTASAMKDLNDLLRTRWASGSYVDQSATDANDALRKVLSERKKELIYRELRWPDIKRLNQQQSSAITLSRNLNGQIVTLPPNDPRYALLIPTEVTSINPLPQNPR